MANAQDGALINRVLGSLLARYVRFVHRTAWQTAAMTEQVDAQLQHLPCIVGMWHGQFMLMPLIKPPGPRYPIDVMLARHRDAGVLGEALKRFDMQLIRGAGAAGARQGSRRQPCLQGSGAGPARGPRGGHDCRRAGRTSAARRARHRHGRAPVAAGRSCPLAIATSRYIALNTWSRMTINLPWSELGFAVGRCVHVPRDASTEDLERYRRGGRGVPQLRRPSWPTRAPAPIHRRATPGYRPAGAAPSPACGSRPIAPSPRWRARWRPCCSRCASGAARRSRQRRNERLGQPERSAARRAARLVPCGQRRRDQRHPAADLGARASAARPVVPAHHRHGDLGQARRRSGWARAPCISTRRSTRPSTCAASSITGGRTSPSSPNPRSGRT